MKTTSLVEEVVVVMIGAHLLVLSAQDLPSVQLLVLMINGWHKLLRLIYNNGNVTWNTKENSPQMQVNESIYEQS